MSNIFKAGFRVYYEDTDAAGVVYYANYLKFAERARTEMLRESKISQRELMTSEAILFVVRKVSMDLFKPARLDDYLEVSCEVTKVSGASVDILQTVICNDIKIAEISVLVACIDANSMRPKRLPENIKEKII